MLRGLRGRGVGGSVVMYPAHGVKRAWARQAEGEVEPRRKM